MGDDAQQALWSATPSAGGHWCEIAGKLWDGLPFADVIDGDLILAQRGRLEGLRVCSLEGSGPVTEPWSNRRRQHI